MGGRPRFTFDYVQQTFKEKGCTLLETEYVNARTPLRYIATCGHEHANNFGNFYRGKGMLCPQCRRKANGIKERLGYERIKSEFESAGCRVINDDFQKQTDPVRYIALCGHENVTTYMKFHDGKSGRLCRKCSKSVLYEYDYVREQFELHDCELLEETYINCNTPMRYIAQCGHESTIKFSYMMNNPHAVLRCRDCHKHTYHEEPIDRNRTASKVWRKAVYEKDSYNCVACGHHGGELNAHHLNAYDNNPDERFEVKNGVTLCPSCHIRFHSQYGFGGNTKEQFEEWLKGNTVVSAENKGSATP